MAHFLITNFLGDPNLGLYGFATDRYCLIGLNVNKIKMKLNEVLKVPVFSSLVIDIDLLGIFVSGNSHGVIVPKIMEDSEIEEIKKNINNVLVIKNRYTALGNLILMNDKGILISPLIKKNRAVIEEFFGIPCRIATIAGLDVIGKLGIATNTGCLVHPKARKKEIEIIKETLGVDVDIGTVNFGSSYPGAGLIANSDGIAVSEMSSGPELGRITEVFGFLE